MICEICGKTDSKGFKVKIEGTIVASCASCAIGHVVVEKLAPQSRKPKMTARPKARSMDLQSEFDIDDEYGPKIKKAREKMGLTQDDLGKAINENHSLIHRIELGKLEPSEQLAKKIERKLKIKLISAHQELDEHSPDAHDTERTLGDLIVVRKRDK